MNKGKNTLKCLAMLLLVALLLGCSLKKKDGDHADEKGEPIQITAYSRQSELFMEFTEPVAGEKGPFLIKLTRLSDWKPVAAGPLKLVFTPAIGPATFFTLPAQARPGVYRAELALARAGTYELAVIHEGKGGGDLIEIPQLHVLARGEDHKHEGEEHGHEEKTIARGREAREAVRQETTTPEEGHPEKGDRHAKEHDAGKADEAGHHDEAGHPGEAAQHEEAGHGGGGRGVIIGTGGGTISYAKEQQWSTEFLSRPARRMELASSFVTIGELVPVSNAEATVSAPVSGIISHSRPLPFIGKRVSKGEVVAVLEPPVSQEGSIGELTAGYAEAKNRVTLAQKEYDRAKRLHQAKIAPLKRVEEAELSLSSARAALEPLQRALEGLRGDSGNGKMVVRAPVSGTVVEVAGANGKGVQAGEPIVRIINTAKVWLKASLPASEAGKASQAAGATFTVTGLEGEFRPSRLVTVNDMLDPQTRTLPVIFEVPNPGGTLKIGMFADVSIRTGAAKDALAVPADALVEDEGRWFLFIQTAGEWFERREVKVGAKDRGHVQVIEGLEDHERVVVKGAYYVKLAATAGKAADPHAGHGH